MYPYPGAPDPYSAAFTPAPAQKHTGYLVAIAVAAVIAVLALGGCGYLAWRLHQQAPDQSAVAQEQSMQAEAEEARKAAATFAQLMCSVDYAKFDENLAQVLDGATGEFKDMYAKSSAQLRQMLIDSKAQSQGKVLDSAVESQTPGKVVVILFVDQSVTNTTTPTPNVEKSRVKITMEKVGNRWLASKVDLQ